MFLLVRLSKFSSEQKRYPKKYHSCENRFQVFQL